MTRAATTEMAQAVVTDLRQEADEQPNSRQGSRWATELSRAAATVEMLYGLGDSLAPD